MEVVNNESGNFEAIDLIDVLKPETEFEFQLLKTPEIVQGLLWGKPRYGHPEGQVYKHILEVFTNIDRVEISESDRKKLRIIALLHDTFKFQEFKTAPRDRSNHHGIIARKFAASLIDDKTILDIIELHDEAYFAWRLRFLYQDESRSNEHLAMLLERIGSSIQLYYIFFKCDTFTGDKTHAPVFWFESHLQGIKPINFK